MKKSTITNVLDILNVQKGHADRLQTKEQQAYYDGMLTMANLIISDGYTLDRGIITDKHGNHGYYKEG